MPWDVQIIICDMLIWIWALTVGGLLLILICRRIWQMREAELELKEIKRRWAEMENRHHGY